MVRYFNFEPSFNCSSVELLCMQEICSSNPPVVTGICDPNKSQAQHHHIRKCFFFKYIKCLKSVWINIIKTLFVQ